MENIDLVIKIPESIWVAIQNGEYYGIADDRTYNAIKNGRPSPKGEWRRMSDLSEDKDDRYECSRCGNVIHYKDKMNLYTFNSWCGRCGSDNGRK